MAAYEILIDYTDILKTKRNAQFEANGKNYMVGISVNPWNGDVLFSLHLDRNPVVVNRVAVLGERILSSFGVESFADDVDIDFLFFPDAMTEGLGNKVDYRELGSKVKLYYEDRVI